MPYTLVLFALAAFGALVLWLVYAILAGYNQNDSISIVNKILNSVSALDLVQDEEDWIKNKFREQMGYEGAVLGFLVIISYACVYGALKIAHHKK